MAGTPTAGIADETEAAPPPNLRRATALMSVRAPVPRFDVHYRLRCASLTCVSNARCSRRHLFDCDLGCVLPSSGAVKGWKTDPRSQGGSVLQGSTVDRQIRREAINFTSDPRQPCGGPPPPSLGGMWSQTDFFDVPSNSSLGIPRQQGFLNFTVASNGNTTVTIIYLNRAGLATGRTHNASGTLDSSGAFSGTGSGPDGRFRMTGQLTATSPEPGSGRMQVRFTFTQHWGTSPSGDVGPFLGTARRTP